MGKGSVDYADLTQDEKLDRLERWCDAYDIPRDSDPSNQVQLELQNVWQLSWALSGEQLDHLIECRCPYSQYIVPGERMIVECRCRRCQKNKRGVWDPRRG